MPYRSCAQGAEIVHAAAYVWLVLSNAGDSHRGLVNRHRQDVKHVGTVHQSLLLVLLVEQVCLLLFRGRTWAVPTRGHGPL